MTAALDEEGLTTSVVLESRGDVATPISFGFHPYLHLSGAPRDDWRLELPSLRRLRLDARRVPTGAEEEFSRRNDKLGDESFDDAFSVLDSKPRFVLQGLEQRLEVLFLEGYPYAQIYAPRERDFVAIEPMTAPANALVSGHGLRSVAPTKTFTASFRVQWN